MEPTTNIVVDRSLLNEFELFARENDLPVEHVVQEALQHGLFTLKWEHHFQHRRGLGDVAAALAILQRAGGGQPPVPGDEIPADLQ